MIGREAKGEDFAFRRPGKRLPHGARYTDDPAVCVSNGDSDWLTNQFSWLLTFGLKISAVG